MLTKLRKQQEGFTIIEVLIVLAIAGLILLIVLLAVPALQRNSRNTSVKNDATALAGAISEYRSNNNGANPASITGTGDVTVGAAGSTQAQAKLQGTVTPAAAAAATAASPIAYVLNSSCGGGGSTRNVAIRYWVETSSGGTGTTCIDG